MEVWIRQSMAYQCAEDGLMPFPVPGNMWDRDLGHTLYTERMEFIRRVDQLGFDGLIFTEHHFGPNGGLTPSPVVMLAAASQVTEQIKLVTMGISLSVYDQPVRLAEELAMIDNLSHGRLVVGLITSAAQSLFAFNVPVEEERPRYHEAYDLMVKAWTEPEPFEWRGEHFDYNCVSILPRPLQQPHPPVWTTCSSEESLKWAARNRFKLVAPGTVTQTYDILNYYREYAEQHCGWSPTSEDFGMAREFYIAPTQAQVDERLPAMIARDETNSINPRFRVPELTSLLREQWGTRTYDYGSHLGRPAGSGLTAEGYSGGQFLVGNPDTVTRQIVEQRAACGNPGVLVIRPEIGTMSLQEVGDGLELFAREVLPTVQALK
jgi:alkanesulfonate monooxygenase SsuD/methylene tetrahydromethanopterin reductase-like flavin-dependent oxidoreductase (luciferase family)